MIMIKKELFVLIGIFVLLMSSVYAQQVEVYEFYQDGCPHCVKVESSGILEKVDALDNVSITKYDIYAPFGNLKYTSFYDILDIPNIGVPLAIINCSGELNFLQGSDFIIDGLEEAVLTCSSDNEYKVGLFDNFKTFLTSCFNDGINSSGKLSATGFAALIGAALIDSINPCAFGVILFLMVSLLNLGSSKRALKAGLLYSFVVFVAYFLAGLGLFKVIQQMTSVRNDIYLGVGVIIFILTLVEFRDYFMALKGKTSILRITDKIKPFIEKYSRRGTVVAIMILGVVVALFELPCTGGIYLGIISMLSKEITSAYFYLLIYNLIFVMPLVVLTFMVYKGMSPERLQKWNNSERTWMKLGAAIVLLLIAVFLLWKPVGTLLGLC